MICNVKIYGGKICSLCYALSRSAGGSDRSNSQEVVNGLRTCVGYSTKRGEKISTFFAHGR